MTLYVDSSALLKRYVDEADSAEANAYLRSDPALATTRVTVVEIRRNLARLLSDRPLATARQAFTADLAAFSVVELDATTCEAAATISEVTGVRTLDALHLATLVFLRSRGLSPGLATYDQRLAAAAISEGFVLADC